MADISEITIDNVSYDFKDASAPLRKFTNYSKTGNLPITSDDTTQTAIGKLEKALDDKISTSAKGTASGVAELDANGKVPSSQLPSYVDDVLEYSAKSSFPTTGETGKIYVDTTTNKTYRWSGSAYVEISESLALGETSSTAYRGDRGKAAYDHSQITNGNPHGTTGANTNLTGYSKGSSKDAVAATDTVNAAIAKHENRINANQSNILYGLSRVGKNILNYDAWKTVGVNGGTAVWENNGVTLTATSSDCYTYYAPSGSFPDDAKISVNEGDKIVLSWEFERASSSITGSVFIFPDGNVSGSTNTSVTTKSLEYTVPSGVSFLTFRFGVNSGSGSVIKYKDIMVCYKHVVDTVGTAFEPPALPNYDLTRLEAEDRAALAEEIDAGAKNKVDIASITTTGSSYVFNQLAINALSAGSYVFSYSSTQADSGNIQLVVTNDSTTLASETVTSKSGRNSIAFTINGTATKLTLYSVREGTYSDFMLCTKAAFGVSNKFVPFGNDPFYQVPINHNMIYRGRNLGATLTDAQHTALSSGNFTDLYLGDYWTKTVTIPAGTYTGGDGEEVTVSAQTNITLKAVIADFDTFYAGYASTYAGINTHHAAVIVTGFSNVVWNKTNSTAGGYVASLIHKWLVGSALPQIETWFGSAKVLSHQKLLTNAITGDAASGWAWSSQQISLLSENQMYGSKVWGNSKASNGGYEPGEAFKHLNVFNHIDANLLFGNKNILLRDISSAVGAACLSYGGSALNGDASKTWIAPAALILLS